MKKSIILSLSATAVLGLSMTSCNCGAPAAKLSNDLDSVAYAFGVLQGSNLAAVADSNTLVPENQVSLDEFLAGFMTAVRRDSSNLKMTAEEADAFLREYFNAVQQKMQAKKDAEMKEQKAKGAEFLAENAKQEGVEVLESGLQIKHIKKGTGKTPAKGDQVLVNYTGKLIDGTVFDSNDSVKFNTNQVVKGFSEGLMNMQEGGTAVFTFPSDLGYGDRGAGKDIPGGATLQFQVDLLEIIPAAKK